MTWSLSAAASAVVCQNGARWMPGDSAGISTTASRSAPEPGLATATLALIRFIDQVRLHGFFTPLTVMPPSAGTPRMVGVRMCWPGLPSAKPELSSHEFSAIAMSIAHSNPLPAAVSSTREATEKWCMVVATASDGDRLPTARWMRTASSREAPLPSYSAGISRAGPPSSRNFRSAPWPGFSSSSSGISLRYLSSPGR